MGYIRCLNRVPGKDVSIEEEPFSRTDLSRFANAAGIVDFSGTVGIPLGALDLMYQEYVRKMPVFLEKRMQKIPASKLLGERNALAGTIAGKTEFSIFVEALFKEMPKQLNLRSPLHFCFFIIKQADAKISRAG